ncbi:carcinoembryonic antigen-related cell adhesion molecule 2-like isoform X2 [Gouania willdenowi]|uniref:carcinoembryonic antigen-related cell adhesion molecule 2-like isoform X2 n=1 Tax=Gouania willdenowi TaxID=441366 RepID=UPI001054A4FF|nr:carcinoembryonic antigen-related cell adhesion molecule 2-like isoform X2 [Gouania willdenowi]
MESSFVLVLTMLITTLLDRSSSQVLIASENPVPVGHDVTFHRDTTVSEGVWMFNGTLLIVLISGGTAQIFDPWNARAEYNPGTSSLTLRSVTLKDSGQYLFYGIPNHRGDLTLSVQVPVSNVSLRANAIDLVEHSDTAVLMCSVSKGTSLSYKWLKDDSMITAGGNVELSDGNVNLTINNVTRFDGGSYICNVSNGLNHEASQPVYLNVSYGPLDVSISGPKSVNENSSVTLNCSAISRPESTYHWYLDNNSNPISNESVLTFTATDQHKGSYICEARNPVTNITKSETHMFTIATSIIHLPSQAGVMLTTLFGLSATRLFY